MEVRVRENLSSDLAWRAVAAIASVAGIALLPVFRRQMEDDRLGIWIAFALPFALGLVAMTARMETRTRILALWLASLLASFVVMISLWTGFGLVAIAIIVTHLVSAWGLNEASAKPDTYERRS